MQSVEAKPYPTGTLVPKPSMPTQLNSQNSAVIVKSPKKNAEGMSLRRYRFIKSKVKFYELKLKVTKVLTKAELNLLARLRRSLEKARKLAAPELIRLALKRKAAMGHGKKRGSDLVKLMKSVSPQR